MKLGAFAPEAAFLPALARLWLADGARDHDGLILLPSRRAAQALAGAFLAENGGQALLLPRILALGALDEAGLTLTGALDTPPAIAPMRRQAILARLILQQGGANGAPTRLHTAWALAADLAALLDEADYAETDLAETLPGVVGAELASHWQTTLEFLKIITEHWPNILAGLGAQNPASRQRALIDAQTAAWEQAPPQHRVWMVASEGNPAICRLARRVAQLPAGLLLLPGHDFALDQTAWEALEDSHAQAGIRRLLGAIGARRDDISPLPAPASNVPGGRGALLSRALLPAACLADWQVKKPLDTTGLSRLEAGDEAANATAIAMILRDALEVPGRTAALITPDRGLAVRVAAALQRFGLSADDSAGEELAQTPPAILLRLLARAAAAEFAPLPLLALLKHPLTAAGLPPEAARDQARRLERAALRGPRPAPGLSGIKFALQAKGGPAEQDFLDRLELRLRPLALPLRLNPAEALRRLLEAAEALAATEAEPGPERLWSGEAGLALSELFWEALPALEDLPDIPAPDLADLLDALLTGAVVRKPRTKDAHPRVAIWGVREAALQRVDVAVLGGLVEGVWPKAAEPGPWLSRPMRKAAGLPAPEQATGAAAHDFFSLAASCETVVLAAPARRERAPAVPARWLTRLNALLDGAGERLPEHDAAAWAAALDLPLSREARPKPRPRPPASQRPTALSISDFSTLLADPYAIYARKILNIRELPGLDEESDPSLFGDIVHAGLKEFFAAPENFAPPRATERLTLALHTAMRELRPRAALEHWWAARLARIAAWILETEAARRREHGPPAAHLLEHGAELQVPGGFVLKGRVDRIERRRDGSVFILDYKTGTVPTAAKVETGTAPQLPLEAVMAEAGAFGAQVAGEVTELAYWQLSGRFDAGDEIRLFAKKPDTLRAVIDQAAAALPETFARFARAQTPYLAAPHPDRATYQDTYAGISRRAEWAEDEEAPEP